VATFFGTALADSFNVGVISDGVTSDPVDSLPSDDGDTYLAGDGNDRVGAGAGADWIEGEDGDDTLLGGLGADILIGGEGNDSLAAEAYVFFPDVPLDTLGNTLIGGMGDDGLEGALGDDSLDGGPGNDFLSGNAGVDSLFGGPGDDRIAAWDYDPASTSADTIDGGSGRDTLLLSERNIDTDLRLGTATPLAGVVLSFQSIEDVHQEGRGGTIRGTDGPNSVYADGGGSYWLYGGSDYFEGGGGVVYGGDGSDALRGYRNRDRLFGQNGDDFVLGQNGNDLIFGGKGDDTLGGDGGPEWGRGNGQDILFGAAGDDSLFGDFYSDTLYGGVGSDRFVFRSWYDSKYERIDHIRGGAPTNGPVAGAADVAFEAPGRGTGDLINLSEIDADESRDGNQLFILGRQSQGGLWIGDQGNATVILGYVDEDEPAELVLYIHDRHSARAIDYSSADFIL
jgi:Ca2+-binding RTX toxin-like protein